VRGENDLAGGPVRTIGQKGVKKEGSVGELSEKERNELGGGLRPSILRGGDTAQDKRKKKEGGCLEK